MKVAVIGANGQLGQDVASALRTQGHEVAALNHSEIAVESPESVRAALESCRPDLVVNTAAFTNVDRCEDEAAQACTIDAGGAGHGGPSRHELRAEPRHTRSAYVGARERRHS